MNLQNEHKKKQWFAVYTKFRCEKLVMQDLMSKDIDVYLPLLQKTKRYQRKVTHSKIPLINCYVFVRISDKDRIRVLQTQHVFDFLKIANKLIPIPENEINMLKKVVGEIKGDLELTTDDIAEGDRVEIISGNLTGIQGTFLNKTGKKNFVVQLEHIGYNLIMQIDPSMLRRLSAYQMA